MATDPFNTEFNRLKNAYAGKPPNGEATVAVERADARGMRKRSATGDVNAPITATPRPAPPPVPGARVTRAGGEVGPPVAAPPLAKQVQPGVFRSVVNGVPTYTESAFDPLHRGLTRRSQVDAARETAVRTGDQVAQQQFDRFDRDTRAATAALQPRLDAAGKLQAARDVQRADAANLGASRVAAHGDLPAPVDPVKLLRAQDELATNEQNRQVQDATTRQALEKGDIGITQEQNARSDAVFSRNLERMLNDAEARQALGAQSPEDAAAIQTALDLAKSGVDPATTEAGTRGEALLVEMLSRQVNDPSIVGDIFSLRQPLDKRGRLISDPGAQGARRPSLTDFDIEQGQGLRSLLDLFGGTDNFDVVGPGNPALRAPGDTPGAERERAAVTRGDLPIDDIRALIDTLRSMRGNRSR